MILRLLYAMLRISAGLVLHPYQTMQSLLAAETKFVWLTLLPSVGLACITIIWRFMVVPTVGLFVPCSELPVAACAVLPFIGNALTFFCVYWQLILLYLLYRFSVITE